MEPLYLKDADIGRKCRICGKPFETDSPNGKTCKKCLPPGGWFSKEYAAWNAWCYDNKPIPYPKYKIIVAVYHNRIQEKRQSQRCVNCKKPMPVIRLRNIRKWCADCWEQKKVDTAARRKISSLIVMRRLRSNPDYVAHERARNRERMRRVRAEEHKYV